MTTLIRSKACDQKMTFSNSSILVQRHRMLHEALSLIAAGNTQPGGFSHARAQLPTPRPGADIYSPRASLAGLNAAAPPPKFGEATMRLYNEFVEDCVARADAAVSNPAESPRRKWEVTPDMMNQKWGQVLRQLDPQAANQRGRSSCVPTSQSTPSESGCGIPQQLLSARARAAPLVRAHGTTAAYTHLRTGQRVAPAPGAPPQFSALAGHPGPYTPRPAHL